MKNYKEDDKKYPIHLEGVVFAGFWKKFDSYVFIGENINSPNSEEAKIVISRRFLKQIINEC